MIMETYLILKAILVALALVGAFGFFSVRVRRLYGIMRAVQGKSDFTLDRIGDRIRVLFTDVLGQSNVRRKQLIGTAHMLIFLGFLAVQPHSVILMIQGVIPAFEPGNWVPGIYSFYLFVADILAFLVLFGLAYAVYRRLLVRPSYLTTGRDSNLIIVFTSVIIFTFLFINAALAVMPAPSANFSYAHVFPVSGPIAAIFQLQRFSPAGIRTWFEINYWIHIPTILGFLVYIPGSKHLHLLAAAPNVFLKRLERAKAMEKTDIEDETAETFGLGKVSELSWKNVLNLYACTECGRCEEQCPATHTAKPLSPKNVVHDLKVDLLEQAPALLAEKTEDVQPIFRQNSPITGDVIWACTTCRACEDICPVNIEHLDLVLEVRKQRVLMEADFPPEMQETFTNLENQFNPWGFSSDNRADWCKGLDVPLMTDHPEAQLLYFVGCAGSFDDRGKKIAQAMVRVLQNAGVDFAILGPEEACTGDVARRAGNEYIAQMLIRQNVEVINQYRPPKILAGCPHCYNIIKNEFPQFGGAYNVVHHTQFLLDLFRQEQLTVPKANLGALTYHDSCYLGRWNGIFQQPRDLLAMLSGGNGLVEMPRHGDKGFCCGAGGARMFMEETIGTRINNERASEVIATGARIAATACPFCMTMLRDGIMEKGADVQVKDIVEIIAESVA
jgi:Fe-S oxidoreductase